MSFVELKVKTQITVQIIMKTNYRYTQKKPRKHPPKYLKTQYPPIPKNNEKQSIYM